MSATGEPAVASKKPKDSDFYQQRLKAWQPILTPKWVVISFLCIGIPFLIIGLVCKNANDAVVEYRVQYDGDGLDAAAQSCSIGRTGPSTVCTISIPVTQDMNPPVYVYYELQNFYQNHRRYVKSKSDVQLAGTWEVNSGSLVDCDPLRTQGSQVLFPCGLIAASVFNDTFALSPPLTMSETDISWASDRNRKFKAPSMALVNASRATVRYIDQMYPGVISSTADEHFIVWMRVAALPTFRKLYGRINEKVAAGTTLTFTVASNYRVASFEGKKAIVVSTVSFLGGKNAFIPIAYIVVGALCIGLALLFGVKQFFGGRRLGDTQFLVWQTRR